uniref:carboxypeptidase-like regulatory domain-containing protein n=1 Tax=Pseudonocardia lacus TaxID=2835865 RepID=UPI001BDC75FB
SPAEQAAEQAAADLALLRTFGYADPGLRPETVPVVSLASPHDPEPEPEVAGAAQPVRFRVAGHGGAAVGGAAVTLLDDRGRRVASGRAGDDGTGSLDAPRPGAYMLVASAPAHQSVAVAVTVVDGPATAVVALARSASVSGGVYGEDGPIAGARVTLVQDSEIVDAVDSAADGGFRLDDVPAGEYGLSVAAAGCEPFATLLVVPEETAVRRDVELRSALAQPGADDAGSEFPDVADLLRGGGDQDPPRR